MFCIWLITPPPHYHCNDLINIYVSSDIQLILFCTNTYSISFVSFGFEFLKNSSILWKPSWTSPSHSSKSQHASNVTHSPSHNGRETEAGKAGEDRKRETCVHAEWEGGQRETCGTCFQLAAKALPITSTAATCNTSKWLKFDCYNVIRFFLNAFWIDETGHLHGSPLSSQA